MSETTRPPLSYEESMHLARLQSLGNVDRKIARAQERIRAAQAEIADLEITRREILDDMETAQRRAPDHAPKEP